MKEILIKIEKILFEDGSFGWHGMVVDADNTFLVPAHPHQTKGFVESRVEAYLKGEARYFKL